MNRFGVCRERLTLKSVDTAVVEHLKEVLNVPVGIARILAGRNLLTFESCKAFFRPESTHFHDPFLFPGMETAVERIVAAIGKGEKIAVYGDYDVDGVSATALMIRVLRLLGADCLYHLPNRLTDGYGVSENGIRQIARSGATLIITVDCGVTAVYETEVARSLHVDMIITDHHEPKEQLPAAIAVLNPKIPGSPYPDATLAGVGVALKLCQALAIITGRGEEIWRQFLDLVALGTAADIVPLTGENRIIVKLGYELLSNSEHRGLRELIVQQGLSGKRLSTSQVVFQLAPCINAVGRLGDPRRGVELLLTDDAEVAAQYAKELRDANLERRALDSTVAEEACAWVNSNCSPEKDYALVIGREQWHVGVIGIVASKLVDRFHRPSILFSIDQEGLARGSGRSIPGVHLLNALDKCADLLEGFGGHAAAAGMSIQCSRLELFRERFNEVVSSMVKPEDLVPEVRADTEVSLSQLTPKFYRIMKEMEPFGPGNMRPVLLCRGLHHRHPPRVVGNNHIKMAVSSEGAVMDAIGFNFGERIDEVYRAEQLSLAFSLEENEWNGRSSLQMKVKGIAV